MRSLSFLTSPSPMILLRTWNDELIKSLACGGFRRAQTCLTSRKPFSSVWPTVSAVPRQSPSGHTALSLRRLRTGDAVLSLAAAVEVESRSRTFLRRAISSSMAVRILSVVIDLSIGGVIPFTLPRRRKHYQNQSAREHKSVCRG